MPYQGPGAGARCAAAAFSQCDGFQPVMSPRPANPRTDHHGHMDNCGFAGFDSCEVGSFCFCNSKSFSVLNTLSKKRFILIKDQGRAKY